MAHSIIKVKTFQFIDPYRIEVFFDDGSQQVIDFEPVLVGPLYGPLKDPILFAQAFLDPVAGTLVWPNGADFDPDTLYHWSDVQQQLASQLQG